MRGPPFGAVFCVHGTSPPSEAMGHDNDHAGCSPDSCFTAKMRYWRAEGSPAVHYTGGQSFFHGATIRERQTKAIAEGRAAGLDPVPTGARWV